ncbi:OLC1v1022250C1 [Oldenlandia corymbosa var. corymbosa]|uniref:OLC1v1022250C1 n=1 Tax=Oldenlandia corymbosa var. corymbosa TaxID=529605 RepID=A0AAV1BYR5_OLDCO|nr:OLC1v1022250C1 [Oldenlandia corymbosa var. corymbosa]
MAEESSAKSEHIQVVYDDVKANVAATAAIVEEDAKAEDDQQNGADCPKQDEPESNVEKKSDVNHTDHQREDKTDESSSPKQYDTNDSAPDDQVAFADLKESEKKALEELRSKVEEAILMNKLLVRKKQQEDQKESLPVSDENVVEKGKEKVNADEELYDDQSGLCLWGVPLMPSKGDKGTDVILLKFLKARDFKANDALDMLSNTLQWRAENKIDSILTEDLRSDYDSTASINGVDRRGHPVCYNVYGVFGNDDMYNKTFGTQESRDKFLRWRLQLMERQIQMLDFRTPKSGSSSLVQINDLKDTPGPSRKDLRLATRQAVALLQDNYPEFVARNIFINVPFWYYAFNALLSPFLIQRTKSKFVFARANRVTETLLKYISGEEIPVRYGGLKREDDPDFSTQDGVSEITVKSGSTEVIEIPALEVSLNQHFCMNSVLIPSYFTVILITSWKFKAGSTLVWDLTVIGWEVNYKEEFVPSAEDSYTVIVKKERRIAWQEGSLRNLFKNNEPGKVVLTIENGQFKRKRVLYRFKTKQVV